MSKKYVIINILYTLFQVTVVVLLGFWATGDRFILLAVSILLGTLFIASFFKQYILNPFKKMRVEPNLELLKKYQDMITKAEEVKGKKIPIYFVEYKQLINPAFYYKGAVYINKGSIRMPKYSFEGLLAHELGHAISGYADKYILLNIRITVILSRLITQARNQRIIKKKRMPNKVTDKILYGFFFVLTYLDDLILYKFIREEEYKANEIACMLSDGHSLRTYYYYVLTRRRKDNYNFDLLHPTPQEMLVHMEQFMFINEYNQDVYYVNDRIYYVTNVDNRKEDLQKRYNFYEHVASHQNTEVLEFLFNHYYKGLGTELNFYKALEVATASLQLGSRKANFNLGKIYETLHQYEYAIIHYERAINDGFKNAKRRVEILKLKLEDENDENWSDTRVN